MNAVLQFRDYHVLESQYKSNPFSEYEEENTHPNISYKVDTNPSNINQAVVRVGIELGDKKLKETSFYVKAKVAGVFEIADVETEMSDDQVISFYKVNAIAILFPYLRSLISDLTSKGSDSPIIFPTLNIASLISEGMAHEEE
ncbi:protein-export chaperone SecB [Bacillus nitratireducens]|uniref:protein-export chaperone SecB n=1 Tax=Bacillus nitratireducens TaxID=2026193 RepID=UPI002E76D506|nr:protein-export chaperone SecB [Bacillus nitratireducens]